MTASDTIHSTFTIERVYSASPERVFEAFRDPAVKRVWFAEVENFEIDQFDCELRVGGHDVCRFRTADGTAIRNDTYYHDIVDSRRIVYEYAMRVGDHLISASLSTIEFTSHESGTRLTYTEQGAFFDGADKPGSREHGCKMLLERLADTIEGAKQ
jgi:uncharacterized protein YndB with AHSA1/START domain